MDQVMSPLGRRALESFEGKRLKAYRDSVGRWTIGVGHTSMAGPPEVSPGLTITDTECDAILARDLAKFEARVRKALGPVPQPVFDAAVSFDYNCGAIDHASWVAAYKAGDPRSAEQRLLLWNKGTVNGKLVPIAGLTNRRAAEADMMFRNTYPGGGHYEASGGTSAVPALPHTGTVTPAVPPVSDTVVEPPPPPDIPAPRPTPAPEIPELGNPPGMPVWLSLTVIIAAAVILAAIIIATH